MRIVLIALILCSVHTGVSPAQPSAPPTGEPAAWTGSPEEKLWGLMVIWAETRYAFPWFDERPDLDWDATVQEFIPRVLEAPDLETYYRVLAELVARLEDSHTSVLPPWGHFTPGYDHPPLEIRVIENRFLVVGAGDTEELATAGIRPGLEIVEIDGVSVQTCFEENVLRYRSMGSPQANEAVLPFFLLYGPQGETVRLVVADADGTPREVTLTRSSAGRDGSPFFPRFLSSMMASSIDSRTLEDGILYVNLPTFENDGVRTSFLELIDSMDLSAVKGMILDLRYNMGGSSIAAHGVVSGLIDTPVTSPTMTYPLHVAAEEAWGHETRWSTVDTEVIPREGKRYLGPLVVLTSAITHSSAEDAVIELQQTGRATVVGERTAGGGGHGLPSSLPGGGTFRVSTFRAAYPDGTPYITVGIAPDVEVVPTRREIRHGEDPALAKAVEELAAAD